MGQANQRLLSFELLCRCLTLAQEDIAGLRQQLTSGAVDWESLVQLASAHYVTPSLYRALGRKGLDEALPAEVRDYLATVAELNAARNRRIYEALVAALGCLNGIGVQPVLLKGAIALLPDQYQDADARVIGDLDLLVPPERIEDSTRALQASGYAFFPHVPQWMFRGAHHTAPLAHPQRQVKLELHREAMMRLDQEIAEKAHSDRSSWSSIVR